MAELCGTSTGPGPVRRESFLMFLKIELTKILPGWLFLLLIAVGAGQVSELVTVAGRHPLEASAVAIVLGLFLRFAGLVPEWLLVGAKLYEKPLIVGIVLLGAGFNLAEFGENLLPVLLLLVVTMIVAFTSVKYLAAKFGVSERLAVLLAIGTTICGTTAVAITAPLLKARPDETGYAVGAIAFCGLLALLFYPLLGILFGMSDLQFGVFAGAAIHSTAQVVGAGYIYSYDAGATATAIKLLRNVFMAPAALVVAFWWSRQGEVSKEGGRTAFRKSFPWFLFGYFVMAYLGSQGHLSTISINYSLWLGKLLIVMALAGIGIATDLKSLKALGKTPMIVALLGTGVLAIVTVALSIVLF